MTILETFQFFRQILCVCPCCNSIVRLSDLRLKVKGVAKTWLDDYESKTRTTKEKETEFQEQEEEMREKAAERGRKKVPKIVRKSFDLSFGKLKYNPYDIKALLHPVDFVVFDGLNGEEEVDKITFLSKRSVNPELNAIRKSLKDVIDDKKYDWQVARVSINGKIEFEKKE